jgi:hypothetical protein
MGVARVPSNRKRGGYHAASRVSLQTPPPKCTETETPNTKITQPVPLIRQKNVFIPTRRRHTQQLTTISANVPRPARAQSQRPQNTPTSDHCRPSPNLRTPPSTGESDAYSTIHSRVEPALRFPFPAVPMKNAEPQPKKPSLSNFLRSWVADCRGWEARFDAALFRPCEPRLSSSRTPLPKQAQVVAQSGRSDDGDVGVPLRLREGRHKAISNHEREMSTIPR